MAKKIVPQEPCIFCGTVHQGMCPPPPEPDSEEGDDE